MPPDNQNIPDKLQATVLAQIGDRRLASQRTEIARLKTELGIVRSALPEPRNLYAAAQIIDYLVPEDPEPQVQDGLRGYAEHIQQIMACSGVGKECWAVISVAALYVDAVQDYNTAMGSVDIDEGVMATMESRQQDLMTELLRTVEAVRPLLPPKLIEPRKEPETDDRRNSDSKSG